MQFILIGITLILFGLFIMMSMTNSGFTNYIAYYAPESQKKWFERPDWERFGYPNYSYWENFESPSIKIAEDTDIIMKYAPDTPDSADIYNNQPYHLLGDEMAPPRVKESISCVNSRSCYATNFERMIDKTGNYRQMTNNFKRGYPDSCSAPYQELVLNFYKTEPMAIPLNNTGKSVSEAN